MQRHRRGVLRRRRLQQQEGRFDSARFFSGRALGLGSARSFWARYAQPLHRKMRRTRGNGAAAERLVYVILTKVGLTNYRWPVRVFSSRA